MKFHRLILSCLMVLCFASSVFSADKSDLKKCMGALNVIIEETKKNPTLSSDVPEGMSGLILMKQDLDRKELDDMLSFKGNVNDIYACIGKGVESSQIDILIKAYYGILSDDPHDDLANCYAGLLGVSQSLENNLGEKKSQSIALLIEEKLGSTSQTVTSIYNKYNKESFSHEEIQSKSLDKLKHLASEDGKTIEATLKKYIAICDWYNIPLESTINGVAIGSGL